MAINPYDYKETVARTKSIKDLRYKQGEEDALAGIPHRLQQCPYYHAGWKTGRKHALMVANNEDV